MGQVQPSNVKDVLLAWKKAIGVGTWKGVPLAVWWCMWKEWNCRIFKAKLYPFKISSFVF